jgi:hypothetical protein
MSPITEGGQADLTVLLYVNTVPNGEVAAPKNGGAGNNPVGSGNTVHAKS